MFSRNNNQQDRNNPSLMENQNGDVEKLISQGDAIYDYERVPAAWSGFDEQPSVYVYGDAASEGDNADPNRQTSQQ